MRSIYFKFFLLLTFCNSLLFGAYDLAVCAIFRDEGEFFKEWIEFHKLQGVKHFFLYNHISQDNYLEVLGPYVESGDVTLIDWPFHYNEGDHAAWIKIQTGAYMHCIQTYGTEIQWLAAIDIDEFLFCPNGFLVSDFMKAYKGYGGLCVNWVKYGTSDVETIPPGFCMLELLTRCLRYDDKDSLYVKSIVQPRLVEDCKSPHAFLYKRGKFAVDEDRMPLSDRKSKKSKISRIRINHYWTRTISYFMKNKIGLRQERRPEFTVERLMRMAKDCNECCDPSILPFVPQLRKAMGFDPE